MRLLFLAPFVPWPADDGGRIRVFHILTGLAARHEVDLLALCRPGPGLATAVRELRRLRISVEAVYHRRTRAQAALLAIARGRSLYQALVCSRALERALERRLREKAYDLVQCEYAYMAHYRKQGGGVPWVLDEHNVEFHVSSALLAAQSGLRGILYRPYARREYARRRREEVEGCRRMDHVLTVSNVDREHLLAEAPGVRISVVPNGVDLEHFRPSGRHNGGTQAVFVGNMEYRPNADGVTWFCKEVLPRIRERVPSFSFLVIGKVQRRVADLTRLMGVTVEGWVPDTRPYLEKAAMVVVPLRAGGGTRFKILEALAAGCAVVSTSIGAEGLGLVPNSHLRIADDPQGFADTVIALLADPAQRSRLGHDGRRFVEERYGWPAVVAELERVHAEVVHAARRSATGQS